MSADVEEHIAYPDREVPVLLDGDDPFAWDVVAAIARYVREACGFDVDCESITIVLVEQAPVWRVPEAPSQGGRP